MLSRFVPLEQPSKKALPINKDKRSKEILKAYDELAQQLEKDGFFQTNPVWYTYKTLTTWSWIFVALFFQWQGWYLTSALFTALFWQQLGWLGHEYAHHQIFRNRQLNDFLGWFCGNVLQGYSVAWWKDRHNSHHATTNILDADPDIDNIPMLAWSKSDVERAPAWCKKTIVYQAYYFLALLPVLRMAWFTNSIFFCRDMRTSKYSRYRKDFLLEAFGLALHWTWVFAQLYALPTWGWRIAHFLISELLAGFGTAIVVFFNHYSCDKYDPALAENFVCLQLYTTRNMTPGPFTDWICGGLNYQIEHHLFPTMPRHNLSAARIRVQRFCQEQKFTISQF
jgi:delta8-fatty-acid desaturase